MLRILHLEDQKEDAELIQETVISEGIRARFTVVTKRSDFISALEQAQFDLILADYGLPDFDGLSALKMVRKKYPKIGFVCLSGSNDPALIKASFDAGATDYVSKGDLPRLIQTLRHEQDRRR